MRYPTLLLATSLFLASCAYAQNVGIGTTTPGTKLTVAGGIASTPVSAAAAASVTIPNNASIFYLTAVAGSRTDALTMAAPTAGQYLTIYNLDANPATFAGYTITASTGVMTFQYINGTWQAVSDNSFIGGSNYIKNQTGQQASSNFNISGNGVIGGTATVQSLNTAGFVTNTAAGLLGTLAVIPAANGGTGVSNAGTITNASNTIITGGGTLGLGGYTLTVPATGTVAEGTGTINYPSYWSGANTLTSEQYLATVRGGMGANMTAGAIGAIPYSTSTTTYGTLADVAAGAILVSGGVGTAPSWISSTGTGVQGYWTRSGTTLYNTNTGDNVGIGSTTPAYKLDITGQARATASGGGSASALIANATSPSIGWDANGQGTDQKWWDMVASGTTLLGRTVNDANSAASIWLQVNRGSGYTLSSVSFPNSGVGIGINPPVARLDVQGTNARSGTALSFTPSVYFTGTLSSGTTGPATGNIEFRHDNQTQGIGFGYQSIYATGSSTTTTSQPLNILSQGSAAITLNAYPYSTGSVGIGTTAPNYKLDVAGSIGIANNNAGSGNRLYMASGDANHWIYSTGTSGNSMFFGEYGGLFYFQNTSSGANQITFNNGYAGIGTTTPTYQLTLAGGGANPVFGVDNGNNFEAKNTAGTYEQYLWPRWTDNVMYLNYGSGGFNIRNDGSAQVMFMTSGGLVGINNNTAPYTNLDVIGSIFTSVHNNTNEHATGEQGTTYIGHQAGNAVGSDGFNGMKLIVQGGTNGCGNTGDVAFNTWECNTSTSREIMHITGRGMVGIGTSAPNAPLDVEATPAGPGTSTGSGYAYFSTSSYTNQGGSTGSWANNLFSIIASARILCHGEIDVLSDRRIKNVEDISNTADDLNTLGKIQVTDFNYKDKVEFGGGSKKGFIAQQVEDAYPQAITRRRDFIPDVYAAASHTSYDADRHILTVSMSVNHGLCLGDKVRIITADGKKEGVVYAVLSDSSFTVGEWEAPVTGWAFVFGKEVDDFRVVDYDRIYTLNVSATQELSKQLKDAQARVGQLEAENERLRSGLSSKVDVADYNKLKASVETLQQIMQSKAEK